MATLIIVILSVLAAVFAWAIVAPIRCPRCRGFNTDRPDEQERTEFLCAECGYSFDVLRPGIPVNPRKK
jgi:transposase-like protein